MNVRNGLRPNLFVVGTAKSGTSSLAAYLRGHPDVCFSRDDEPNFFALDENYSQGLEFYESQFDTYNGQPIVAEKSWRYSCRKTYPEAWRRLRESCPDFKVIYIAREPFSRAKSMWREMVDSGYDVVNKNPSEAILTDSLITESSLYFDQISPIIDDIGRDKVLLMCFEDFVNDNAAALIRVAKFIGIAPNLPERPIHENPSVDQRIDGVFAAWLRRKEFIPVLTRLMPRAKPAGRRIFRKPIKKVEITPEAERRFREFVAEDSARYLELAGKPADFWARG